MLSLSIREDRIETNSGLNLERGGSLFFAEDSSVFEIELTLIISIQIGALSIKLTVFALTSHLQKDLCHS